MLLRKGSPRASSGKSYSHCPRCGTEWKDAIKWENRKWTAFRDGMGCPTCLTEEEYPAWEGCLQSERAVRVKRELSIALGCLLFGILAVFIVADHEHHWGPLPVTGTSLLWVLGPFALALLFLLGAGLAAVQPTEDFICPYCKTTNRVYSNRQSSASLACMDCKLRFLVRGGKAYPLKLPTASDDKD